VRQAHGRLQRLPHRQPEVDVSTSYAYRQRTYVFINYFNGIVEGEGLEVGNDPVAPCGAPRVQCTDEWRLRRLLSHVVAV
jgi:hypothetical protein